MEGFSRNEWEKRKLLPADKINPIGEDEMVQA
jgi:hypothetical protein